MKRPLFHQLLLLISGILFLASCNEGKKLMKEGQTLETGGLRSEALEKYTQAYYNFNRTEGLVGMKRMSQGILDGKFQSAQMSCMVENYEVALSAYEDAFAYQNQQVSLELKSPPSAMENYQACKSKYIESLYEEAESAVLKEEYEKGQNLIRKILSIDRRNQKAQYLDLMCEVLPNYNAGKRAMELEMWREAHVYFDEVCLIDAGYKDASAMRAECLKKGSFAVAYKIKDNKEAPDNVEKALGATIKGELLNSRNPYLELLERENLDVVIQEQQETLSPEFDSESSSSAGKLKRAQFILSGELVYYRSEVTPEVRQSCDCANKLSIYSDKVNCYEITSKRKLEATFKYQLIDAETGKLFISDVITFSKQDDGLKFDYEIQKKFSLMSPTGYKNHEVDLSTLKKPAPDLLLSEQDLLLQMNAFFSNKVSAALSKFSP
ncbi:MAG: CsgG/HfaB family protein [Flavobacteriales bacterium]